MELYLYFPVCLHGMELPLSHPYHVTRLTHTQVFCLQSLYIWCETGNNSLHTYIKCKLLENMQKIKIETLSEVLRYIAWLTTYQSTQHNIPENFKSSANTTVGISNLTTKMKFQNENEVMTQ